MEVVGKRDEQRGCVETTSASGVETFGAWHCLRVEQIAGLLGVSLDQLGLNSNGNYTVGGIYKVTRIYVNGIEAGFELDSVEFTCPFDGSQVFNTRTGSLETVSGLVYEDNRLVGFFTPITTYDGDSGTMVVNQDDIAVGVLHGTTGTLSDGNIYAFYMCKAVYNMRNLQFRF
jgi:hypothetical protein